MIRCSALTKKRQPCKNLAKYESEGKPYCGTHYTPGKTDVSSMSQFDRKLVQIFGTDLQCRESVTIEDYAILYKTSSKTVYMSGESIAVQLDDGEPITVQGQYHLKFNRDVVLNPSADDTAATKIRYRGIVTISKTEGQRLSFVEWSTGDKLEISEDEDLEKSKYILEEPTEGPIHDILALLRSGKSVFITGEAGTGKSYNIGLLTRILDRYEKTSSTGTSAHHIGGRTIHSFSGLGVTNIKDFLEKIEENSAANYKSHEKYLKYRDLHSLRGTMHSLRSIETVQCREDALMYALIVYRYLQFMYPSSRYSERLKAVYQICSTTVRYVVTTDDIAQLTGITASPADIILMKYLLIETNALCKLSHHADVLTRIVNKIEDYRKYDPAYRINEVQYLIVDEVSMLSNYDMEMLDWQMRTMRNNTEQFMGGVTMIFVGDLLQLAPVKNKRTTPDITIDKEKNIHIDGVKIKSIGEWTFGDILKRKPGKYRCNYVVFYTEWMKAVKVQLLTKNYRQSTDTTFRDMLNSIRVGQVTEEYKQLLQSRVVDSVDNDSVVLFGKTDACERRNRDCLDELDTDLLKYDCEYAILYSRNNTLGNVETVCSEYTPSPFDKKTNGSGRYRPRLELKVGAKVMLLTNLSIQHGLVNGALGTVTDLSRNRVTVKFETVEVDVPRRTERVYEHTERDSDTDRYIKTEIYMKQYPLTLAYGITIHKSQGNTYDDIVVSMTTDDIWSNDHGKAYVALSRCRTLDGLRILSSYIPFNRFTAHEKIVALYRYWTDKA